MIIFTSYFIQRDFTFTDDLLFIDSPLQNDHDFGHGEDHNEENGIHLEQQIRSAHVLAPLPWERLDGFIFSDSENNNNLPPKSPRANGGVGNGGNQRKLSNRQLLISPLLPAKSKLISSVGQFNKIKQNYRSDSDFINNFLITLPIYFFSFFILSI